MDSRLSGRSSGVVKIVTLEDADAIAGCVLREVSLDGDDHPNVRLVARRWGAQVYFAPRTVKWAHQAEWIRVNGQDRIYVRSTLPEEDRTHPIAHELGHVAIERFALRIDGDIERWCNRFGSALLCPANSVSTAWRRLGHDLRAVIDSWPLVPPTAIAMRVAECASVAMYVVQGRTVRYSFAETPATKDVIQAARQAVTDDSVQRPGLRSARLRDGRDRAAVIVEDEAA